MDLSVRLLHLQPHALAFAQEGVQLLELIVLCRVGQVDPDAVPVSNLQTRRYLVRAAVVQHPEVIVLSIEDEVEVPFPHRPESGVEILAVIHPQHDRPVVESLRRLVNVLQVAPQLVRPVRRLSVTPVLVILRAHQLDFKVSAVQLVFLEKCLSRMGLTGPFPFKRGVHCRTYTLGDGPLNVFVGGKHYHDGEHIVG